MTNPYLIQRMRFANQKVPGYKKGVGQLGDLDSRKLVKYFCEFEYMGSSEFEFGTIANTFIELAKLAKDGVLKTWQTHYNTGCYSSEVGPKIWTIGNTQERKHIDNWIWGLVAEQYRLKEPSNIVRTFNLGKASRKQLQYETVGWLDVENKYMFSISMPFLEPFIKFWGI